MTEQALGPDWKKPVRSREKATRCFETQANKEVLPSIAQSFLAALVLIGSDFSQRRLCTINVVLSHACIRTAPHFQCFLVSGNSRLKSSGIGFLPAELGERVAEVVLGRGPIKGNQLPRPLFQRFLVSGNSRLKLGGANFPLTDVPEREAEVVLGHGPLKGDPLPRPLFQRFLVSGNSRLKLGGIGLPPAEVPERVAKVVLGRGPIKGTRSRVRSFNASW
jgi:hypothetical protein